MKNRTLLIFISALLACGFVALTSGDALAQKVGTKPVTTGTKDLTKGKATIDMQATYLGKVAPSEQKAAQKRARLLGLKPGIAGRNTQARAGGII